MLIAISRAFDLDAVDGLLFLTMHRRDFLVLSGDGLLRFARLIVAGLASVELKANNSWQLVTYAVNITEKGRQIVEAWRAGDPVGLSNALGPMRGPDSGGELPT